MFIETGGTIKTSPPLGGHTTLEGRSGDFAVWRNRPPGGSVLYLVKLLDEYNVDVVRTAKLSALDDMLLEMKLRSNAFDPQTAASILSRLWSSGRRDIVSDVTPKGFTAAVITLTSGLIPLDVAMEAAIAIGLEAEKCRS